MLERCRQNDWLYEVPEFNVRENDVSDFMEEFGEYHEIFGDCFQRRESREHFYKYMVGQFGDSERKSIEPIALKVEDGKVRPMQRFVGDAEWNDKEMLRKYRNEVCTDMGDPNGVLIFDETGFVKKGGHSVGVGRQYCGSAGKVENCQVGVFAAYASPLGYALIDRRLFVPERWFGADWEKKREKCKMPKDPTFKKKTQLAGEMFDDIRKEGILPFKYVVADTLYGTSPDFIAPLEDLPDITYLVAVPFDTLCWKKMPVLAEKEYKHRGKSERKKVLAKGEKKAIPMIELAKGIGGYFWYERTVSEGTKGPIRYEFSKRRVVLSINGLPDRTVWLVMKRTISKNPVCSFYISNAFPSTRLETFVWLSGIRWAIEQCFEETKSELGMDHYEVRKWRGWHHHILSCMLGHFFLWHLKIKLGEKNDVSHAFTGENND